MKEIKLTQGKVALVDDCDFEELSKYKWYASRGGNTFYAARCIKADGHNKTIFMHRQLLGSECDGFHVDHIDGCGTNNQMSNLRKCLPSENQCNQRKQRRTTTSSFKGVCWEARLGKWRAQIDHQGKRHHIGYFDSEEQAVRERDAAAIKYHGEFAKLNATENPPEMVGS